MNQNKAILPFEKSQVPLFSFSVVPDDMMAEIPMQQLLLPSPGSSKGFGNCARVIM